MHHARERKNRGKTIRQDHAKEKIVNDPRRENNLGGRQDKEMVVGGYGGLEAECVHLQNDVGARLYFLQ